MKTAIWIVVVLIVLGGAWWYFSMSPATTTPTPTTTTTDVTTPVATDTSTTSATGATTAPMTASVMYGAQGFTPSTVTVANGGTVTWVNQTGSSLWVASNPHPEHTGYDGTSRQQHCPNSGTAFDECAPGNNYSFTFHKVGTWGYHNHMNPSDQGTVVVQ